MPDPVARDYLLLALRLDQRIPGLVDGYFGPAELKARVDMEQGRSPARLRDDAAGLRDRLAAEVADADRRAWLDAQLVALETQAAALAGEPLPYLDHVTRCFAYRPPRRPDAEFDAAAAAIDALLPGNEPLADRLDAFDRRFEIAVDRLPPILDWLVARFRATAAATFGLPDGEDLRVSLVRDQPWSGYNWFDGGRRSRVDINTDLPIRPFGARRYRRPRDLSRTPSRARVEGGRPGRRPRPPRGIDPADQHPGVPHQRGPRRPRHRVRGPWTTTWPICWSSSTSGPGCRSRPTRSAAKDAAERTVALTSARRSLLAVRGNAAILRHADGRSHEDVLDYLRTVGRMPAEVAAKRLEFIEHPLWRTYVFIVRRGRGTAPSLGRRRAAGRPGGALRSPPARAAHACGGRGSSSRLKRTRSSPSPSKSAQDGVP